MRIKKIKKKQIFLYLPFLIIPKVQKEPPASKLAPFHPAVNSNTFLINSNEKVWAGGKNESKKRL